ncbi:MAG: Ig-like domain-containing protein [Cyclobacteriaceae bacterium]
MKTKWLLFLFATSLLAQQCAKQTAPTGGPKDEDPPMLVRSNPKHKEVNFNGNQLNLVFNELVQLNNPREKIIITPGIGKKFETVAKKNKVTLSFNSELKKNTTYTINFRESIQDITEKNPAPVKLAFSTGPFVDSLAINGSLRDILTSKATPNYTVALIEASDTFNIFKHAGMWVTQADKKGRFTIENLKPGNYFLYAFDDRNKNLIVDSKSEKFGFNNENINLTGPNDSIKIDVFKLDMSELKLLSARQTFAYFNLRFSKSLINYTLASTDKNATVLSTLEPDLTTIKIYNTIPDRDSLAVRLQAQDSLTQKIDTLVYIKFPKKESTKDNFTYKMESADVIENKSLFSAHISFNKPVAQFNPDSITLQIDSLTTIPFTNDDVAWNENLTHLTLNKKIELKKESSPNSTQPKKKREPIKLFLGKATVISIENDSLKRSENQVKLIKPEDFGLIITKVETTENFTLQLLDKSGKIIREVSNIKNYSFENIPAGNYQLRILIDQNKNQKWDPGNYFERRLPEPVIYYTTPKAGKDLFLKANWQVGPLLISY